MGTFCQRCNSGADTADGPLRPECSNKSRRDIFQINEEPMKEMVPTPARTSNSGLSTAKTSAFGGSSFFPRWRGAKE